MERKEVIVSEQELARQKEFTRKVREMNDRRTRTPLALVDTFGCQQNVADGEVLMGMLREMGYELTRDENQADVILLNTCAIREHAEKRVYGHLGRLSHTKAAKPDQIICLCGCMAQQKVVADKVKNSYHHVDLVLGPQAEWRLPELLRELCRLPFHWVRLHYLYPDNLSDELIDTIAGEAKICNYLDIPIQHCNDTVLKAMRRRETKAGLEELFRRVRERIPGVVLRTSLITGLPYEDEAAFEELCDFLGEQKLQRVGAFPYSPEEGTPAARMLNRVDTEEAQRRAELVMEIQTQVMDEFNDSRMGDTVEVLCDGYDVQAMSYVGRSYAESPGIDGCIFFTAERDVEPGDFVMVRITGAMDGDLTGEAVEELSEEE